LFIVLLNLAYCCRYSIVNVLTFFKCHIVMKNFPWENKWLISETFVRWIPIDMHINRLGWSCSIDWYENLVKIFEFFRRNSWKTFERKCMLFVVSDSIFKENVQFVFPIGLNLISNERAKSFLSIDGIFNRWYARISWENLNWFRKSTEFVDAFFTFSFRRTGEFVDVFFNFFCRRTR